jgi:hypothetical protein
MITPERLRELAASPCAPVRAEPSPRICRSPRTPPRGTRGDPAAISRITRSRVGPNRHILGRRDAVQVAHTLMSV